MANIVPVLQDSQMGLQTDTQYSEQTNTQNSELGFDAAALPAASLETQGQAALAPNQPAGRSRISRAIQFPAILTVVMAAGILVLATGARSIIKSMSASNSPPDDSEAENKRKKDHDKVPEQPPSSSENAAVASRTEAGLLPKELASQLVVIPVGAAIVGALWNINTNMSESNSPRDKGKEDQGDKVNETSSKERAEIIVNELKNFCLLCQSQKISADETFETIEKKILAKSDLKNEAGDSQQGPRLDQEFLQEMIHLCDMEIKEASTAPNETQEKDALKWVKAFLERKILQTHPPAGHSLSPLHPRGVPHSRGIGILPHQSAAQRQGSPFSPGQHNSSTPRGAVSEERQWRDRPGSAPVHTDPPQQPGRRSVDFWEGPSELREDPMEARERLEGGKELRERKRKIQEEMMNIIAQFSSFLERESALGKSYSEMEETVNKMYKMLVERFIAFGGCGRDLEKLKKELNRLMFLSKYPHKSEARI